MNLREKQTLCCLVTRSYNVRMVHWLLSGAALYQRLLLLDFKYKVPTKKVFHETLSKHLKCSF